MTSSPLVLAAVGALGKRVGDAIPGGGGSGSATSTAEANTPLVPGEDAAAQAWSPFAAAQVQWGDGVVMG